MGVGVGGGGGTVVTTTSTSFVTGDMAWLLPTARARQRWPLLVLHKVQVISELFPLHQKVNYFPYTRK